MELELEVLVEGESELSLEADPDLSMDIESGAVGVPVDNDYLDLDHKPSIEGVELVGDRLLSEFGLSGGDNVNVDHGNITIEELTAAQVAALLVID